MQARYVIGQDGVIAYAHVNSDYSQRPKPSEILLVLRRPKAGGDTWTTGAKLTGYDGHGSNSRDQPLSSTRCAAPENFDGLARLENTYMDDISADETDIEATLSLADAKLGKLIEAVVSKIGRLRITAAHSSPFEALTRAIIYQQMSAGAAAAIYKKLQHSLTGAFTPGEVLALPHDALRAVGLSKSKAQYVHNLAEWFNANPDTAKICPPCRMMKSSKPSQASPASE